MPAEGFSPVEELVQKHYHDTTTYFSSLCRYQVTLPSRSQALHRYMNNEKSILSKGIWKPFQDVVQSYLDLGHAELIPSSASTPAQHYYLPMHSVSKQSSTSTKLRVVFDGSATTSSSLSLNQSLLVGPTLHPNLSTILMKFRIAISADI